MKDNFSASPFFAKYNNKYVKLKEKFLIDDDIKDYFMDFLRIQIHS